jgi:uncharacterized protein DUF4166
MSLGEHCMYARALGPDWHGLAWAVRNAHADRPWRILIGRATVRRGRTWRARIAGWLFGFPPDVADVPCSVEFATAPRGERWWRRFGGHPMSSTLSVERGRLYEAFGALNVELKAMRRGGTLVLTAGRARFGPVPLPRALSPEVIASEKERDGRFLFRVSIRVPIAGLIAAYRGTLRPVT